MVLGLPSLAQLVKNLPAMQETMVQFLGQKDSPGEGIGYPLQYSRASLVSQLVKNPPAMWETGFNPWIGKILWRRERLPTAVFWPGECIVHGILQARIRWWVAYLFSRGSSQFRDRTQVSPMAGGFFTSWATREALIPREHIEKQSHYFADSGPSSQSYGLSSGHVWMG